MAIKNSDILKSQIDAISKLHKLDDLFNGLSLEQKYEIISGIVSTENFNLIDSDENVAKYFLSKLPFVVKTDSPVTEDTTTTTLDTITEAPELTYTILLGQDGVNEYYTFTTPMNYVLYGNVISSGESEKNEITYLPKKLDIVGTGDIQIRFNSTEVKLKYKDSGLEIENNTYIQLASLVELEYEILTNTTEAPIVTEDTTTTTEDTITTTEDTTTTTEDTTTTTEDTTTEAIVESMSEERKSSVEVVSE